eukprot:Pgem_evm2s16712
MTRDPRADPRYKERIPYVVAAGPPRSRLYEQVVDPLMFLNNDGSFINTNYYIEKQLIPPLDRIFKLI